MIVENLIKDYIKAIKEYYILPSGELKYPTNKPGVFGKIDEIYFDESMLYRTYFYLNTAVFTALFLEDKEALAKELSSAKAMSFLVLRLLGKNLCSCSGYKDDPADYFSGKMVKIVQLLTPCALAQDWKELKTLTQFCIDSLNAKGCIVGRGQPDALIAWYVIKLLSMIFEQPIDKRKPFTPSVKKFKSYQLLLDNWDIEDMIKMERQVYLLCELHILADEYIDDNLQYHMDEEVATIFPYEVIIWLKLREYKGLKNPKNFSHPLMQTKLMKKLLRMDTNLPTPQSDLELKLFLEEKVQVMCPDVEVPEWLEENTEKVNEAKSNDIIPDDFLK
jgi:hypothetical protein